VECKQYKNVLGPKYIRDFIGALQLRKLKAGFFVTTSGYSQQAQTTAKQSDYQIYLLDGERLGHWQRQIQQKVEKGESHHTAFIPFPWWLQLSRSEQIVLLILLFLTSFVVTFAIIYVGGDNSGLV
jgi:hypothetical protein